MSLDVKLELETPVQHAHTGIFIRENGATREISRTEWDEKFPGREPVVVAQAEEDHCAYAANITHNLARMAAQANLHDALWYPDEHGYETAGSLIEPLERGLALLKSDPDRFSAFNPDNGWGDYEGLVGFVEAYLAACRRYPVAKVRVSR